MRSPLVLTALVFAACGELTDPVAPGGGGVPIDPSARFTRVQNEIFSPTCAAIGCHDVLGQQSQLVLAEGRAYAQIVGRPSVQNPSIFRITPGDPANSYLYRKVIGSGISGDRMPQGQTPLNEAQLLLVRDWIRRGAPND